MAIQFASEPLLGFYSRPAAVVEGYAAFVLLSVVAYRADIRGLSFLDHWTVRRLGVSSGSHYVLHTSLLLFSRCCVPQGPDAGSRNDRVERPNACQSGHFLGQHVGCVSMNQDRLDLSRDRSQQKFPLVSAFLLSWR
jgi:hypothetical protein